MDEMVAGRREFARELEIDLARVKDLLKVATKRLKVVKESLHDLEKHTKEVEDAYHRSRMFSSEMSNLHMGTNYDTFEDCQKLEEEMSGKSFDDLIEKAREDKGGLKMLEMVMVKLYEDRDKAHETNTIVLQGIVLHMGYS